MSTEFSGKIVLITGASKGIGRGIAKAFAEHGATTILVSSSATNLKEASEAIAETGLARPDYVVADLRLEDSRKNVFKYVQEHYGKCDILINSAGATRAGAFTEQSEDLWQDGFALKFFGCVSLCRQFWPLLVKEKGHIVNIIGGAARTPDAAFLIGGSVNAAMHNFTKGLSTLGKREGVNVNAILPGLIETDRVGKLFQQRAEVSGKTMEQERAQQIEKEGLNRLGTPEDVAALTLFICSEAARHIQGTGIAVDGGGTPGLY